MKKIIYTLPLVLLLLSCLVWGIRWGKTIAQQQHEFQKQVNKETLRQFSMLRTLVCVANAGAPATDVELSTITAIYQKLGYDERIIRQINLDIKTYVNQPCNVNELIPDFKEYSTKNQCKLLLQCAIMVGSADGNLSAEKKAILESIYKDLDLSSP